MRLSIIGCPDKKRFRPYVKRAALFYGDILFAKRTLDNIFVQIKFDPNIGDFFGFAEITDCNDYGKPNSFLILVNPFIGAKAILTTIAHEMVHVKQYVYRQINDDLTIWKGQRVISDDIEYWLQPWEIEAHGLEVGLFQLFAEKEKLWEVFEEVVNSNDFSSKQHKPLGWK